MSRVTRPDFGSSHFLKKPGGHVRRFIIYSMKQEYGKITVILVGEAPILNKSQPKASLHGNIPIDSGHQAPQRSIDYMLANHKLDEWSLIHEEVCPTTLCANDNWTAIGMQNDQFLGVKK